MTTLTTNVISFPEAEVSVVDAYLRGLPSEATRTTYRRAIVLLDSFLGDRPLEEATRRDIEAWRIAQEQSSRAPATIAKRMSAVAGLYDFMVDEEIISRNPAARARRPKVADESPRQGVSPAEVRSMIRICDPESLIGLRDWTMIIALSVQGWRISELLGLRVDDLGEELGHKVATITGKGAKVSRVPLAGDVWTSMIRWMEAAGVTSGPLMVPVSKSGRVVLGHSISRQAADARIKRIAKAAGLKRRVHAHLFRHGCATAALDANVPLRDVQDHLRHADPRTTRRYDSHRRSLANPTPHVLASKMLGR